MNVTIRTVNSRRTSLWCGLILLSIYLTLYPALGQTREQVAIWTFDPYPGGTSLPAKYHALIAAPTITLIGDQVDLNAKGGHSYGPDLRGIYHIGGQAAAWDDVAIASPGVDGEWRVILNTTTWKSLQVRFDYRCEDTDLGDLIDRVDIQYRTSAGGSFVTIVNDVPLTANNQFQVFTRDFTATTALDNRSYVELRFWNLNDPTGNGAFRIDNFEVTALPVAPAVPTSLTVVASNSPQVRLTWAQTANSGADGFYVYRATASTGPWTPANRIATINSPTILTYIDTSVVDNTTTPVTTYYYRVSAFNSDVEGTLATAVSRRTPPAPPAIISCTQNESGSVALSWNASANTSHYRVRRSVNPEGPYTQVGSTITTTSFTDTSPGANKYYLVVATNNTSGFGYHGAVSRNSAAAKTSGTGNCSASAPSGLIATPNNTPSVTLTWNAVSGASSYTVWRSVQSASVGPAVTYAQVGSPTSTTAFTDNTVSDGTTYFYVVSALVGTCVGPISTEVRAIVPAAPPTGLTATTPVSGQVALSWTASSGAISYNVKRSLTPGGPYTTIATTASTSFTDMSGGGVFYYVVSAINHPQAGESRNSLQASVTVLYLVLNEVKSNPPGSISGSSEQADSLWEYIELKGPPGYDLVNHRLVVLNGANASPLGRGRATLVVPLSGTVPASGIVQIKQAGHASPPGTMEILIQPTHRISVGGGNTEDELIVNNASTILLTFGGTAPAVGADYDVGNNGGLEQAWFDLGQAIIDSLGWKSSDPLDFVYNGVPTIQQAVSVPDAATRFVGNVAANSPSAWYGGCLIAGCEDSASLTYETDPAKRTANFPAGGWLTPGAPNDATTINQICPQSGVVGDAYNPDILFTVTPATVTITGATSSDQSAVPDGNITIINNGGGSFTARINPIKIGYNTTIRLTPNSGAPRPFLYAASAKDFVVNGFHAGASDASTTVPISPDLMFVGDDEKNEIKLYNRTHSGLFLSEFDFSVQLGVTKELDIEGSSVVGTQLYWIGSHANDSSSPYARATHRERIFQTGVTGSGAASTLNYVGSSSSFKDQVTAWDATQVPSMQLSASAAPGVDPNTPTGFAIEGLAIANDQIKAFVGFRAPLVPPGSYNKALLVPVNNFTAVANGSQAPTFGTAIQLDLGSRGIRSIERYSGLNYVIAAGRPSDSLADFALFNWVEGTTTVEEWCADLLGRQVEGIIEVITPGVLGIGSQIRILEDGGNYDWYVNGIEAKNLLFKNYRKTRSTVITLGQKASVTYSFALLNGVGSFPPNPLQTPGGNGNYGEAFAIDHLTGTYTVGQTYHPDNFNVLIGFARWNLGYANGSTYGPFVYDFPGPTAAFAVAWDPMQAGFTTTPGGNRHAALWVDPDQFVDAHPAGYVSSEIWGMSRVGSAPQFPTGTRLVGFAQVTAQDATAFHWDFNWDWMVFDDTPYALNGLPSSAYTKAVGMNFNLQIVGFSGVAPGSPGVRKACVWEANPATSFYSSPTELPDLSVLLNGQESRANAINDNGTIVGYSYLNSVKHACFWKRKGSAYAVFDLGLLPGGVASEARDINNRGQIVGVAWDSSGAPRACTWLNGRIVDLNTRTTSTFGVLSSANSISDNGRIVGGTTSSGPVVKAYSLIPQ